MAWSPPATKTKGSRSEPSVHVIACFSESWCYIAGFRFWLRKAGFMFTNHLGTYIRILMSHFRLPVRVHPFAFSSFFRIHMDETSAVLSTNSAFYAAFTAKVCFGGANVCRMVRCWRNRFLAVHRTTPPLLRRESPTCMAQFFGEGAPRSCHEVGERGGRKCWAVSSLTRVPPSFENQYNTRHPACRTHPVCSARGGFGGRARADKHYLLTVAAVRPYYILACRLPLHDVAPAHLRPPSPSSQLSPSRPRSMFST